MGLYILPHLTSVLFAPEMNTISNMYYLGIISFGSLAAFLVLNKMRWRVDHLTDSTDEGETEKDEVALAKVETYTR